MEQGISYLGKPNHLRLANRQIELLLSTDYGPRIIRCAPIGGENLFAELPPATSPATPTPFGEPWRAYGGHRLWHAPEDPVRTYWPDNGPVAFVERASSVLLSQGVEPHTLLSKSMEVALDPDRPSVTVIHRIRNDGGFAVELALWSLTMMAKGGVGLFPAVPFVPFPEGLLPARPLVLWPYTRLSDPRWTWGDHLIQLRQDPSRMEPQKVGFYNGEGWLGYRRSDVLFLKLFTPMPGPHPDFGCNTETFTNHEMLELETLSPLLRIEPGATAKHVETWHVVLGIDFEDEAGAWDTIGRALKSCAP